MAAVAQQAEAVTTQRCQLTESQKQSHAAQEEADSMNAKVGQLSLTTTVTLTCYGGAKPESLCVSKCKRTTLEGA